MAIVAARMDTAGARRVTVEPGVRRRLDGVVGVRRMRRRDEVLGEGLVELWIILVGRWVHLGRSGKVYCHCATLGCMVMSGYV